MLDKEVIAAMVADIQEEADGLESAPADVVVATESAWSLRDADDGSYSTVFMNDEELRQTVVEDLLSVLYWRLRGKETGGDACHIVRFLEGKSRERALEALADPFVRSLTVTMDDGRIELHPDHLQDAMDYAGVWLEGWDALTDGAVYKAVSQCG